MSEYLAWFVTAGILLVVVGFVVVVLLVRRQLSWNRRLRVLLRRRRPLGPLPAAPADDDPAGPDARPTAAIVVNPTKFPDLGAVRRHCEQVCHDHGWASPLWLETTVEDPGTGQARTAIEQGVDVVCPLGGDGTVRAVAAGVLGSRVPLGPLPGGTGNLLARNLDLPIDSVERALSVAMTGRDKRVDVGLLRVDRSGEDVAPEEHHFLVMAGLGFDAAVMANTTESQKTQVGNAAYIATGLRNMTNPQFRARVRVDGGPEFSRRTKTAIVGNCGKLFAGIVLLPKARIDDGQLDAILMSPKGVVGWAAVAAHVLTRRRRGHPLIDHVHGTEIAIRTDRAEEVQLDGDPLGPARAITAKVLPGALLVRAPTG